MHQSKDTPKQRRIILYVSSQRKPFTWAHNPAIRARHDTPQPYPPQQHQPKPPTTTLRTSGARASKHTTTAWHLDKERRGRSKHIGPVVAMVLSTHRIRSRWLWAFPCFVCINIHVNPIWMARCSYQRQPQNTRSRLPKVQAEKHTCYIYWVPASRVPMYALSERATSAKSACFLIASRSVLVCVVWLYLYVYIYLELRVCLRIVHSIVKVVLKCLSRGDAMSHFGGFTFLGKWSYLCGFPIYRLAH